MIFLDANSFYDYYGRKSLGLGMASAQKRNVAALTAFLDGQNDKALPESVFIEVLTHFKDDENKLRKILDFISIKNLKIYHNIRTWGLTDVIINILESHRSQFIKPGELKTFVNLSAVLLKIKIEATIAFCFEQINGLLYVICRSDELGLSKNAESAAITFMSHEYYYSKQKEMIEEIVNTLQIAYSGNRKSPASMLKAIYMDQLNEFCIVAEEIMTGLKNVETGDTENLIDTFQNAVKQARSMGFTGGTDTMHAISDLIKANPQFLNNVYTSIESAFMLRAFSLTQTDYAVHILFPAWLERGAMLDKNDLFDMLVVGTMDFVDNIQSQNISLINCATYLLTYDTKMRNYLKTKYPYNENLIKRFDNAGTTKV